MVHAIMERIINMIFDRCIRYQFNEKDCIAFEFNGIPDVFCLMHRADVCYKKGDRLIMTNKVLEAILFGTEFGTTRTVRKMLFDAGYLRDTDLKMRRYPPISSQRKEQTIIYGMVFPYESFERQLQQEAAEKLDVLLTTAAATVTKAR